MTNVHFVDVQHGWKVFAGAEEIGSVVGVSNDCLEVQRGLLRRHLYRIPTKYIEEAGEGLVDLNLDRSTLETMEVDGTTDEPRADDLEEADVQDEYSRGGSPTSSWDQPGDSGRFPH